MIQQLQAGENYPYFYNIDDKKITNLDVKITISFPITAITRASCRGILSSPLTKSLTTIADKNIFCYSIYTYNHNVLVILTVLSVLEV